MAVSKATAKYCEVCDMWLPGKTQMEEHVTGHKHKKHLKQPSQNVPQKDGMQGKSLEDEHIPKFCEELCASTMRCTHITRMLEVTSDFSPSLLSQWGLEAFPLPWLMVQAGSFVWDCRHVKDPNIPFIFGRVGARCGFIPKFCFDNLLSLPAASQGNRNAANKLPSKSWVGTAPIPPPGDLSNESLTPGATASDSSFCDLECAICQDTFQDLVHLVRAIPCGHHACLDCKEKWIMSQVEANILPIRCFGCLASDKQESAEGNTWPEFYVRASLPEKQFTTYLAASLNIWRLSSPDARTCNTPDCKGLTFVQGGQVDWTCLLCNEVWCVQCRKGHDASISCAKFAEQQKADEEMRNLVDSGFLKQCPACGNGVQKTQGCNHMTCARRTHFCYVCGCKLNACDPYDHFRDGTCPLFDR